MMRNDHENYPVIQREDYWRLDICEKCRCLVFRYPTKDGGEMIVSVHTDMSFHRFGNHNNWVSPHDCGVDGRQSEIRRKFYIKAEDISEEIKSKVVGEIQQQAVFIAMRDFSKPRIRSAFKKGMLQQARAFMNGESNYKNPFSPVQAMMIVAGNNKEIMDY